MYSSGKLVFSPQTCFQQTVPGKTQYEAMYPPPPYPFSNSFHTATYCCEGYEELCQLMTWANYCESTQTNSSDNAWVSTSQEPACLFTRQSIVN